MNSNYSTKSRDFGLKVFTWLLIFYAIFLLGKSLWTNYELRASVAKLTEQIQELIARKETLKNLIVYYQSDSFKELEARRKLGYKKADEKVMLISEESPTETNFEEELINDQAKLNATDHQNRANNSSLWWEYFFGSAE